MATITMESELRHQPGRGELAIPESRRNWRHGAAPSGAVSAYTQGDLREGWRQWALHLGARKKSLGEDSRSRVRLLFRRGGLMNSMSSGQKKTPRGWRGISRLADSLGNECCLRNWVLGHFGEYVRNLMVGAVGESSTGRVL